MRRDSDEKILAVKARHVRELMRIPGVVGVGISQVGETPVIQVYLSKEAPETVERIPKSLEGFGVVSVRPGNVRAS